MQRKAALRDSLIWRLSNLLDKENTKKANHKAPDYRPSVGNIANFFLNIQQDMAYCEQHKEMYLLQPLVRNSIEKPEYIG